jgi:uncharacterized membrane protein
MISFKAVVIEGMEVVFIVIAVGATGHMLLSASLGALAAGLLVILLGLVLHKPLARIPENTLKFSVGVLLSAFGVFWIGEGLHLPRFGEGVTPMSARLASLPGIRTNRNDCGYHLGCRLRTEAPSRTTVLARRKAMIQ